MARQPRPCQVARGQALLAPIAGKAASAPVTGALYWQQTIPIGEPAITTAIPTTSAATSAAASAANTPGEIGAPGAARSADGASAVCEPSDPVDAVTAGPEPEGQRQPGDSHGAGTAAGTRYDAVVVGAGPNGLAAAITLARAGQSVQVIEAGETVGGGTRSAELTLPGYIHDICSAVHPLGVGSPFFRKLPLSELAHPLDNGTAAVMRRSVADTARSLGRDAEAYERLFGPLVRLADPIFSDLLGPIRIPRHPLAYLRFGVVAMLPARLVGRILFREERTRALFAGLAAHSIVPLEYPFTASYGLVLAMLGHSVGWPVARGGSGQIAAALAAYLRSLGGEIVTGRRITSLEEVPAARATLLDVSPRQLDSIAGSRLPDGYRQKLRRYRYGPGVFKLDLALDGPIPWTAAECALAGTVHVGGLEDEIADSERAAWNGQTCDRPFVLVAQPSLFDPTRAPAGKHTAWAYCHVPNGSTEDMTARIEAQIERFAPGFTSRILARHSMSPAAYQEYNPNCIGGDIAGGAGSFPQVLARPVFSLNPYATPAPGIFLCSASTPPGAGVHGMCGLQAARAVLKSQR
jgi:phytoene dehydrogenase-like protein